ncbi:Saccharopine dehydrogenase-domain-containing protein [Lentinula aff. detonsa]|uniref:Saccharopine dehydrogenase-domain-containing protein n=1 Tax=Lentinula aff. detonsa TaxID=2804958 RepID=A0AA38KRP3_9AGAR|nr:Saccharopine dehydrogenase-domain-containing protein [Lentinula aff. detonsa]
MSSPFITIITIIASSPSSFSSSSSLLLIRPITRTRTRTINTTTTRLWSSYTPTTTSLITQRRFSSSSSSSSSSSFSPPQNPTPTPTPTHTPLIIGIRREDARRTWERRAPLTPDDVRRILELNHAPTLLPFPIQIHIQPSRKRIFKDREYMDAGAVVKEDLSEAHVVVGIKEVALGEVGVGDGVGVGVGGNRKVERTYMMFSHTAKGQEYNMPLLDMFLGEVYDSPSSSSSLTPSSSSLSSPPLSSSHLPTLIDYELLTDTKGGKRSLAFGYHAGIAGTLLTLHTLGEYFLREGGVRTPWVWVPLTFLGGGGRGIGRGGGRGGGLGRYGPCVIGVTGSGNVSQGVLSLLRELPHEFMSVDEVVEKGNEGGMKLKLELDRVYIVHIKPEDYISKFTPTYDRTLYHTSSSLFTSVLGKRIAPYLTVLVNGAAWGEGYPRVMTCRDLEGLRGGTGRGWGREEREEGKGRLVVVGDISCDLYGGLEFVTHATTLDKPFYKLELDQRREQRQERQEHHHQEPQQHQEPQHREHHHKHQPLYIQSVDILPASLPLDSSVHFSNGLRRYLWGVVRRGKREFGSLASSNSNSNSTFPSPSPSGISTNPTTLTPPGITTTTTTTTTTESQNQNQNGIKETKPKTKPKPKKILILGTGMVAAPAVRWIVRRMGMGVGVGVGKGGVVFKQIDIDFGKRKGKGKGGELEELVRDVDVVISLLPSPLHPPLASLCITHHTHLVTASYISPEMRLLDTEAQAKGVLLLNEIGLDPGVDHVGAVEMVERVRGGGKGNKVIKSFVSFCGGLPEPLLVQGNGYGHEHGLGHGYGYPPAGPLNYKFSWSPRGVLTAALNGARYVLGGEEVEVRPGVSPGVNPELRNLRGMLEGLPNRDSVGYIGMYGLGELGNGKGHGELRTILRGTLRYKGFSSLLDEFRKEGFLDVDRDDNDPLARPLAWLLSAKTGTPPPPPPSSSTSPSTSSSTSPWIGLPPLPSSPSTTQTTQTTSTSSPQTTSTSSTSTTQMQMTPLDLFTLLLSHKLQYGDGERDMVVLVHEVVTRDVDTRDGDGDKEGYIPEEIHTSSLVIYGTNPNPNPNPPHNYYYESAMARSVGIPVAIAALAVLDGTYTYPRIPLRGVHGPTHVSIRERVLEGMREAGIGMREGVRRVWVRREGEGVKREGGEGERGKGGLEYALIRARREQRGKERREERGREVM